MNILCRAFGHKSQQKIRERKPFTYVTVSIDDGQETGQFSAFQVVVDVECKRCGELMGSSFGFEGLTIPARSEMKMQVTMEVNSELKGNANSHPGQTNGGLPTDNSSPRRNGNSGTKEI